MFQKSNRYKIMRVFFEDPLRKDFQLREISRKVNIAPTSVKRYLHELEKSQLIIREKHKIHGYPIYHAHRDSEEFTFLKRIDTMIALKEIGLIHYLSEKCMPDAIVLFGSAALGEDTSESDIDLFVLSQEEKLDLRLYEKRLNRKIHVFFSESLNSLSKELKNNILNGIVLKGYVKVF
ncbi:nucleotidyltransferase domain-containing protein [Candidatus Woesearchaeota archaeon]|nr:nucleotidyltransferase domain-containing protein [Candidatus Woesearchaeota archaeon]